MLPFIRNTSPYTAIVLLIVTVLLKLHALLHPIAPAVIDGYYYYDILLQWLQIIFKQNAFAYTAFATANVYFQSLLINRCFNKYKLLHRSGYLPAFSYIMLTSVHPSFNYLSLPLLIMWLLITVLYVISSFGQTLQPRKRIFNAGFLLCIAAMCQFSAIGYFLFLLTCLIILRPFNVSEWIVGIMGYITPLYFAACILFLADRLDILYAMPHVGLSLPVTIDWRLFTLICGLVILCAAGLYALSLQIAKMSVYVRRNWIVFIILLFLSIVVAAITDNRISGAWLVVMLPLTLITTNAFALEKSKWFSNFAFYFSLVFVVFCQFVIK